MKTYARSVIFRLRILRDSITTALLNTKREKPNNRSQGRGILCWLFSLFFRSEAFAVTCKDEEENDNGYDTQN
jgi:hypothetical protein